MTADLLADFNPVFIAGPPRCGTTLCSRLLRKSPNFFVPGDTYYMEDVFTRFGKHDSLQTESDRKRLVDRLATIYLRFNEPDDHHRLTELLSQPGQRGKLLEHATSWDKAYSAFMQIQAAVVGATRWANHAPKDVFYVAELAAAFPSSRFVFCIRDPRDFMLSYKYKWRATSEENIDRMKALYNPVLTALLWRASARVILKQAGAMSDGRSMILRYEDLVQRPAETGRKLYEFIGEEFQIDYLNVGFSNSSHTQANSAISSASVGKWVDGLPENEVWWAERITRRELHAFGYETSDAGIGYGKWLSDIMHAPSALYRALAANRKHTGPLLPYLARRVVSLLSR